MFVALGEMCDKIIYSLQQLVRIDAHTRDGLMSECILSALRLHAVRQNSISHIFHTYAAYIIHVSARYGHVEHSSLM